MREREKPGFPGLLPRSPIGLLFFPYLLIYICIFKKVIPFHLHLQSAKMSKVAKYRRQVSEDPDIDSLLSTLSPEEMEELEKELDSSDTDGNIPLDLKPKDQADKQTSGSKYNREAMPNHHEKETKKLMPKEVDVSCDYWWREGEKGGGHLCCRKRGCCLGLL